MGVTDNDRHELLKFASLLGLPDDQCRAACLANDEAETANVDLRPKRGGDHGE